MGIPDRPIPARDSVSRRYLVLSQHGRQRSHGYDGQTVISASNPSMIASNSGRLKPSSMRRRALWTPRSVVTSAADRPASSSARTAASTTSVDVGARLPQALGHWRTHRLDRPIDRIDVTERSQRGVVRCPKRFGARQYGSETIAIGSLKRDQQLHRPIPRFHRGHDLSNRLKKFKFRSLPAIFVSNIPILPP